MQMSVLNGRRMAVHDMQNIRAYTHIREEKSEQGLWTKEVVLRIVEELDPRSGYSREASKGLSEMMRDLCKKMRGMLSELHEVRGVERVARLYG